MPLLYWTLTFKFHPGCISITNRQRCTFIIDKDDLKLCMTFDANLRRTKLIDTILYRYNIVHYQQIMSLNHLKSRLDVSK